MKSVEDCYKKVKSNCFKFIFSQETKENKFRNKERMLKKFLIPFCFWIESKVKKKKTFYFRFSRRPRNGQNYSDINCNNYINKIF